MLSAFLHLCRSITNASVTGDLQPLGNLTQLKSLDLQSNMLTGDLQPLSKMTGLTNLCVIVQ